jgi:pyruvate dehydrogenase (quinone)
MAQTVRDFFWNRLYQWGVRRVFGYPGDDVNGLLGALNRFGEDKTRFVEVRHEEMAAFMASAHGVAALIATSKPRPRGRMRSK